MRLNDGGVLEVNPHGVRAAADRLRARSGAAAAQRRAFAGIDLGRADPTIGSGLGVFVSVWGSGLSALAYELDLLGAELGRSAAAVAVVDQAGAR